MPTKANDKAKRKHRAGYIVEHLSLIIVIFVTFCVGFKELVGKVCIIGFWKHDLYQQPLFLLLSLKEWGLFFFCLDTL